MLLIGRRDLFPRRVDLSWVLTRADIAEIGASGNCGCVTRQTVSLRILFSRWGKPVVVDVPAPPYAPPVSLAPVLRKLETRLLPYF